MINCLYDIFKFKWSATGSVWLVSDTHFDDADCQFMDPDWPAPADHIAKIKKKVHKNDTFIHLGDVGNPEWIDEIKCNNKILITGNHDKPYKMYRHFNDVYTGPLFISNKIVLSHEPIATNGIFFNIHGHIHRDDAEAELYKDGEHLNLASNMFNYDVLSLGKFVEEGNLSSITHIHRKTIDDATNRKRGIKK